MPEKTLKLEPSQRRALEDFADNPATSARLAMRAAVVLTLNTGAGVGDVAERLGISIPTVRLWRRRYAESGIAGLTDAPRGGRPPRVARDPARTPSGAPEPELDRLLRAARRTISRRGFAATRVADIAQEAGVSPATIHYYFQTRDEILIQAFVWAADRLLPPVLADASAEGAISLMARYLDGTIPYDGVRREEYLLEIDLWSNTRNYGELLPAWEIYQERWIEHVTNLIQLGVDAGAFITSVPAEEAAERLVAFTDGLSAQTAIGARRMPTERARELILRFASDQLGVSVEELEPSQAGAGRYGD